MLDQYNQLIDNFLSINYQLMKTVNVKSLGQCPYLISLEPEDLIGQGSYAQVRRAYNKYNSEQKLASKIFDLKDVKKHQSGFKQLTIVLNLPKHPNLVEYKRIKITSKNRMYIIMELCSSSLKKQMETRKNGFKQAEIWEFLMQFAQGYKILNKKSIVHRDIKPDNILIGLEGLFKISDFGLAQIVSSIHFNDKIKGSICYLSPDLLGDNKIDKNANDLNDVYSLGVTLYEMCFKKLPYIKNMSNLHSITNFIHQIRTNSLKFPQTSYSPQMMNLLASMLQKQRSKRCTWEYIYYVLSKKSINLDKSLQFNLGSRYSQSNKKFRIIQISDAFMKNLSLLDAQLYKSFANDSLVIIDHVQAQIIAKRQIVFYCDRLQYRLQIINKKQNNAFAEFSQKLLVFTFFQARHLEKCFDKYYLKLERSQFLKLLQSQKYAFIRNLIKEDYKALSEQIKDLGLQKLVGSYQPLIARKNKQVSSTCSNQRLQLDIYTLCYDAILNLYKLGYFQQCKHVDQLEKWLYNNQKSDGILSKVRKNDNVLNEFYLQNFQMSRSRLKTEISPTYVFHLNRIDKDTIKNQQK